MSKELPIIFSAESVAAILRGDKSQTRRADHSGRKKITDRYQRGGDRTGLA